MKDGNLIIERSKLDPQFFSLYSSRVNDHGQRTSSLICSLIDDDIEIIFGVDVWKCATALSPGKFDFIWINAEMTWNGDSY